VPDAYPIASENYSRCAISVRPGSATPTHRRAALPLYLPADGQAVARRRLLAPLPAHCGSGRRGLKDMRCDHEPA
jgi:hypothetical protein